MSESKARPISTNYEAILSAFDAEHRSNREAVLYLEAMGFSSGQARSAVYQYRKKRGLVRSRAKRPQIRLAEHDNPELK